MFEPCRTWGGAWVRLISDIMERFGNGCEWGGRKGGNALRRSNGSERQGSHQDPAREVDLEGVVAGGFRVDKRRLRCALEDGGTRTGARQDLLRGAGSPRFGGNPAQRDPRMPDRAFFYPEGRSGPHDRQRE